MARNTLTKVCPRCSREFARELFGTRRSGGREYAISHCSERRRKSTARYRDMNPSARLLASCKNRARQQSLPFNLTEDDLSIPAFCPVLGIEICPSYQKRSDGSPSVDRIVPSIGYVKGNVCVISWRANRLKSDASPEELVALALYSNQGTPMTHTPPPYGVRVSLDDANRKLHVVGSSDEVTAILPKLVKETGLAFSKVLRSPGSDEHFALAAL